MIKNSKLKLSFKKEEKETGLAAVGHPYPLTNIKLNKRVIGYIRPPAWDTSNTWRINFSVIKKDINEDGNLNCPWKWIKLKKECETETEAREVVKKVLPKLLETFEFYSSDK